MRYEQALLLPAFFALCCTACKKDQTDEAPHVRILSPADGASITLPDTLLVTLQATDDLGLEHLSVSLLDQNYIPVVAGVGAAVSGTSATVTLALPILSEQLASGDYKLFASVTDGTNSGKDFHALQVTAVPLRLRAVFTLTSPGTGSTALYRTDSAGQTLQAGLWPMDLGGAAISAGAQQLYVAGGATGNLQAVLPANLGLAWQLPNLSNNGLSWFTSLDLCTDGRLYVGQGDGSLRGYIAATGTGVMTAMLPELFRSQQAVTSGDLVICAERHFVTQEERIGIYFRQSGALQQLQALDLLPVRMFASGPDQLLVFGNRNGQGHVQARSIADGGGWEPYTWPGTITAVEQTGPGTWLVALSSGSLQRFTLANAGSVGIASTPVLHALAYDAVNQWVYGGADGQVFIINPGTGAVAPGWAVTGTVVRVLPLLNRAP